ncbi:WD40 repeat-like protein [Anaeromyces robustus]|uniref:WD40 repeat-like protein n=1 Tax=Anaeromyces robustus TaxID=1754192 RepID=A0A1Y1X6J6_9FUNG|nr:WD40 repeat-like protein [Anaeromyces robustus]|eukprot:ORX80924.1 WD40 repeat-like protein [Anaeromyces robustus]
MEKKSPKYNIDLSDRSLLCMDFRNDSPYVVSGGADHGLKVVDIKTGTVTKNLYTKLYGHSEWVTCCIFFDDGRILSGGMDGRCCLWDNSQVKCVELGNGESRGIGYAASMMTVPTGYSISDINLLKKSDTEFQVAVGDYEGKIKIWSIPNNKETSINYRRTATSTAKKNIRHSLICELEEKQGPVVSLQSVPIRFNRKNQPNPENSLYIAAGYRRGSIIIWDWINNRQHMIMSNAHNGACQCLKFFNIHGKEGIKYDTETGEVIQDLASIFLISSARMDGTIKIWAIDGGKQTSNQPIRQKAVFILEKIHDLGISGIEVYPNGKKIITSGIDGKINVISYPVINTKIRKIISKPNILYQIDWHQNVVTSFYIMPQGFLITGCLDGSIAVHYLGESEEHDNERREQFLVDVICYPNQIKDIVNGINVLKMHNYKVGTTKMNVLVAASELGNLVLWDCNEYINKWNIKKQEFSKRNNISARIIESRSRTQERENYLVQ